MSYQHIIARAVGEENTYGTVVGGGYRAGHFPQASTFDTEGLIAGVVVTGKFTEDKV